jgi:signal transduction histidine kinase/DNA-binding response OmpR family regulator
MMGIFRQGLQKINLSTGKRTNYPSPSNLEFQKLNNAIVNTIVKDSSDVFLWIGADSDGGLFKFNIQSEVFEKFKGEEGLHGFLGNNSVKHISMEQDGRLYLSTKGRGVVIFDPKSGNLDQMIEFNFENDLKLIDDFNHTFKDSKGIFWFSSNGEGVIQYDSESRKVKRYHTGNGLANNIVWGTLEDSLGNLWFVTLNGLSRFLKNGSFRNYHFNSGFPLEEFNEGAFFKSHNGEFILGGSNGYVVFNPVDMKQNVFLPPIVLTDLRISNKKITPGDDSKILMGDLNNTKKITLSYFQSVLTLDFAALNFIQPENNKYAYKLEDFDPDWVYIDGRRTVTYTNLPEGDYVFLVKGSNNDGYWNEEPLRLEITILPPPWRTWWALCIYGIVTIGGFLIIRYNAIKSTQLKNNLKIEQLEKQKWKEFHDLKLKYFIDVSHEFRTPLTLILSPLEELISRQNQDNWVRGRLRVMYFNAKRLLLLIDQILEIREIETGHHIIESQPLYLVSLVNDIVDSFKALADKKKIKLIFDHKNIKEIPLLIDKDKLEKILFNLLSNAFKFTPSGGEISVKVFYKNGLFHFEVSDTGKGIEKEVVEKIFERFFKSGKNKYGAGIGLSLTQSLVEILGGKIKVKSQPNEGTIFSFYIPFEESTVILPDKIISGTFVKPIPLEYQESTSDIMFDKNDIHYETILIVEDNKDLRKYLKEQLANQYIIKTAKDGKIGLQKALKFGISLVISDVMMPEMDGFELCQQIKSQPELCHIPVILLTAKGSQNQKIEGLEYGADDYLVKPFNLLELKVRIKNVIDNRNRLHNKFKNRTYLSDAKEIAFNSFDEKLLSKVNEFLRENLDQPNITVENISNEIGLSRVHLFRKLKALTGMSPSDYIKDFRIKNACQLLLTGKYKVADVAYAVGFQDVHYFGKVFKRETGKSPSTFMKSDIEKAMTEIIDTHKAVNPGTVTGDDVPKKYPKQNPRFSDIQTEKYPKKKIK